MECKNCGKKLVKNGIKKGVQYFYCTHCKKSYSGKPLEPKHHIFEEYIARLMFSKCVQRENEFTHTKWKINQIARLLGHHHRDISKWAENKNFPKISEKQFVEYVRNRENGFDILCVLGYCKTNAPSDNLNRIVHKKERTTTPKDNVRFHINELEYLRLVNMPITNRKEAIFILGALLGCRTSEIIGVKYSDIDYNEKTIYFHRTVTFGKEIEQSENNLFVTNRIYPLTQRMVEVIEWLKTDIECNKERLGKTFNDDFCDFLCVQESGNLFNSFVLNKRTQDIQAKALIQTKFSYTWQSKDGSYNEKTKEFQFKWLRYSVKSMMLKAGVSKTDIKNIFGYKQNEIEFETIRQAYDILDKYVDENSTN